jgi:hypothetical protein
LRSFLKLKKQTAKHMDYCSAKLKPKYRRSFGKPPKTM